jgi:hypothetical protein
MKKHTVNDKRSDESMKRRPRHKMMNDRILKEKWLEKLKFWTNPNNIQQETETEVINMFKLITKKCDNRQKLGEIRTTATHFNHNNLITTEVLDCPKEKNVPKWIIKGSQYYAKVKRKKTFKNE